MIFRLFFNDMGIRVVMKSKKIFIISIQFQKHLNLLIQMMIVKTKYHLKLLMMMDLSIYFNQITSESKMPKFIIFLNEIQSYLVKIDSYLNCIKMNYRLGQNLFEKYLDSVN